MSKKSAKIAALIMTCHGEDLDAHYLGYFECFNRELFYDAHDVLEELWLATRQGENYSFYKGLIQLAGAFVHLQKNRLKPSAALFKLARTNFEKYPAKHEHLDLRGVIHLIEQWLSELERTEFKENPLTSTNAPKLALLYSRKKSCSQPLETHQSLFNSTLSQSMLRGNHSIFTRVIE